MIVVGIIIGVLIGMVLMCIFQISNVNHLEIYIRQYEKILDELIKWLNEYKEKNKQYTGFYNRWLTPKEVIEKIEELKRNDKNEKN